MKNVEVARALVFVHAFPLHSAMWGPQEGICGLPAIFPDLPGFGGTAPGPPTLERFAESVILAMDQAGIDRAGLVGLSMGGYTALRLLDLFPERFSALVLADTRAGADNDEARSRRTEQGIRAREEGIGWLGDAMIPTLLGPTTRRDRPEVVARVKSWIESANPEGVARALEAMGARPDSRDVLRRVEIPVLVIVGEEDEVTPLENAQEMADLAADARLAVISGAGHLSNLENPADFNRELKAFLGCE